MTVMTLLKSTHQNLTPYIVLNVYINITILPPLEVFKVANFKGAFPSLFVISSFA
jgi:hypothetical protein